MTNPSDPKDLPELRPRVPANAADWVVRLDSDQASSDERDRFEAWKSASRGNAQEYSRHAELWRAIGGLSSNAEARALLLRTARARRRFLGRRAAIAALAAGLLTAGFFPFFGRDPVQPAQVYETARGESRSVRLEDGSSIVLNTNSLVRVSFYKRERIVSLERGEFFIRVAKDPARPLRVFVAEHEVRALGTAFDVYLDDADKTVEVLLEEGVVGIYHADPGNAGTAKEPDSDASNLTVLLQPGEQAVLAAGAPVRVNAADSQIEEAWREGRIVFDNTLLGEAVKNVNRYRTHEIVLADRRLEDLRISGVFHINDLDGFADTLATAFRLRITQIDSATTRLDAR